MSHDTHPPVVPSPEQAVAEPSPRQRGARRPHRSKGAAQRPRPKSSGPKRSGPQHLYRPHRQDQFVQLGPVAMAPQQARNRKLALIFALLVVLLVLAGAGVLLYDNVIA